MIDKIQIVHKDVSGSLERMPYESVGRLLMALIAYAKDEDYEEIIKDDSQAYTYFPTLQGHVDRMEDGRIKGAKNGSKGGAPIGNQNAKKTSENNLKQPKTTKNKQKQTPNLTLPNLTNNKKTYGVCENVLLTDEEHTKIVNAGYTELIDELSLYISSKGAKYKSHYSTILAWARRREKENKNKVVQFSGDNAKNQFNRFTQRTDDYDYDKLIKN